MEKWVNMETGDFSEEIRRDKQVMSEDNSSSGRFQETKAGTDGREQNFFSPPFICFGIYAEVADFSVKNTDYSVDNFPSLDWTKMRLR